MSKLDRQLEAILGEIRGVNRQYEESVKASTKDGGRRAAALEGQQELAKKATAVDDEKLKESRKAARKASVEQQLENIARALHKDRGPSKAASIGNGVPVIVSGSRMKRQANGPIWPGFKAMFRNYQSGEFMSAFAGAKGYMTDFPDMEIMAAAKARLGDFTPGFVGQPQGPGIAAGVFSIGADGKATLGTTGAAGGYVLPNNLVDSVVKPNVMQAVYTAGLVTVVNGVAVRGVDQPYRTGAPTRALPINWGAAKTNLDEAYGSYTATLATFASIYDVGKQYLRFSAGSAEQDVMDEITKAQALAENYSIIAGAGTGSGTPGVNDPTYGVYTALLAGLASYSTTTTPVSNTLLGSFAYGLTQASAALAARVRASTAWVVDATTFWTAIGQGTDTAGFWVSPTGGPTGFSRTASGQLAYWGVPVYFDANLGSNAATKIAIGGQWDALKFYRGSEFRIDSSDVAGTRWDNNLVGFRGEQEFGVHAGTAVSVGAFQLLTTAIP